MLAIVDLLANSQPLFITLVFLTSLCVGSFLNVVIHRLPIMMQRDWREQCTELMRTDTPQANAPQINAPTDTPYTLAQPRSACPHCGHQITALENIPVLSYLTLRGKCSGCDARISPRYPIVELFTAILGVAVALKFGVTMDTVAALSFTWALIALAGIDLDTQYLPDSITLPLLWAGLLLSVMPWNTLVPDPYTSIIGAAAGYLSLWSVYQLFKLVTGKEGMGYGDFKLLAALGAWLGWQRLPLIILLSAVVGAAVGIALIVLRRHAREVPIPYGPYLAAAGWVALMWGEPITDAYLRLSGLK